MSPKSDVDHGTDVAALRAAGDKLDDLLQLSDADVEEIVDDFDRIRHERWESDES